MKKKGALTHIYSIHERKRKFSRIFRQSKNVFHNAKDFQGDRSILRLIIIIIIVKREIEKEDQWELFKQGKWFFVLE